MNCATRFSRHAGQKADRRGMTLVELLIAIGVGSLVFGAVASLTLFSARSFIALNNYADLDIKSRNALDRISQEIRQANTLVSASDTQLVFSITNPYNGVTTTPTYTWDSAARTLTRIEGTSRQVLLTNCVSLVFGRYQRNFDPSGTEYLVPETVASNTKVIQITWVCSRDLRYVGSLRRQAVNTESVQSAYVVIRKK